jgi:hypothetical protein
MADREVVFRRVPPASPETRDRMWRLIQVANTGQGELQLHEIEVEDEEVFRLQYPRSEESDPDTDVEDPPSALASGETFFIRVFFNPVDRSPRDSNLVIRSNDPEQPEFVVHLRGNIAEPCAALRPGTELDFGDVVLSEESRKAVEVENCSEGAPLTLTRVTLRETGGDSFWLNEQESSHPIDEGDIVLDPGETARIVVGFEPQSTGFSRGVLVIGTDDSRHSETEMTLIGHGIEDVCPIVLEGRQIGDSDWHTELTVEAQETVQLRPQSPFIEDFSRVEWTLVQRPLTSTARFQPSNGVLQPSLYLDIAGEYIVELEVLDSRGVPFVCPDGPSRLVIHVIPSQGVTVTLTWSAPGLPGPSTLMGTDLDLHYLHEWGQWNATPYDAHWRNRFPDWGVPNDPSDDPNFIVDDTTGAGPEILEHQVLEPVDYEVGVYYFADNGFGMSDATLEVNQGGVLLFSETVTLSATAEFWHAATLDGETMTVQPRGMVVIGFP